jgi:ABC-type uncharacterized transport system permease subunit
VCGAALPAALPGPIAVTLCVVAAMAAGAAVAALAGLLKTRYGAHEVINTIMLNFIVSALILWAGNSHFFVKYTVQTRTIPDNATMSHLGLPGSAVNTSLFLAMALSGALAGAVAANYVLGYKHYYERDIGRGVGFMGIAVALLGRNHPLGIVAAALLLGTLSHGGLAVAALVPKDLVAILQAIIILTVAMAAAYRGRTPKAKAATLPVAGTDGKGSHV